MSIGEAIQAARLAAAWSQSKLARKINASQPALSDWERGRSEPSRERVRAIERALGLTDGSLETVSNEPMAPPQDSASPAFSVSVPEYDARAAAGAGAFNDHELVKGRWPFSREALAAVVRPFEIHGPALRFL